MRAIRSSLLPLLGTLLLGGVLAQAAFAGPVISKAAHSLRSDPVYVDPAASSEISSDQAASLRTKIENGSHPMFIAVLPRTIGAEASSPQDALHQLAKQTGVVGAYAFWLPATANKHAFFTANASVKAGVSDTSAIATHNYQKYSHDGAYAVLSHFVDDVEALPTASSSTTTSGKSGGGFPWLWVLVVLGVIALVAIFILLSRRNKDSHDFLSKKSSLKSKINVLQDAINSLSVSKPEAQREYQMAISSISEAQDAAGKARYPSDLDGAQQMYDEANGHYKAALAAEQPETAPTQEDTMHLPHRKQHDDEEPQATQSHGTSSEGQNVKVKPTEVVQAKNTARRGQTVANPTPTNYPGYGLGTYPGMGYGYYGWNGLWYPWSYGGLDPFQMILFDEMMFGGDFFGFDGDDDRGDIDRDDNSLGSQDNDPAPADDSNDAASFDDQPGGGGDADWSGSDAGDVSGFGGGGGDTDWSGGDGGSSDWGSSDSSDFGGGDDGGGGDF